MIEKWQVSVMTLTQRRKARKGKQSQLCVLAPWRETNNVRLTGKVRVRADETEEVPSND